MKRGMMIGHHFRSRVLARNWTIRRGSDTVKFDGGHRNTRACSVMRLIIRRNWLNAALLLLTLLAIECARADAGEVSYSKDVAPILWKKCVECHRPGEVGPFSLLTYDDAAKRADFLAEVTAAHRMPPWKPVEGYGEFLDERRLSPAEIKTLDAWAHSGAKQGDPDDLPTPPVFHDGWQLGKPDLVLKMSDAIEIPAAGPDVYRCFVLPFDVDTDRVVGGVEFHPGNRRVLHHALFYLDNTGKARKRDEADPGPGYQSFGGIGFAPSGGLGGWAPGANPRRFPPGMAYLLKRNSDLVLQVHYHPDGKPETDQSELAIYFAKPPVSKIVASFPVANFDIHIPPGDANYRLEGSFTLPADIEAVGVTPHMHYLGRDMQLSAELPDGKTIPLIRIDDWDFNWQGQYMYRRSLLLPKGTQIKLTAGYDNSPANPHNPRSPPKDVGYGEQTTDEMCFCWVNFVAKSREDYVATMRNAWGQHAAKLRELYKVEQPHPAKSTK
jgi:hypothetical protein